MRVAIIGAGVSGVTSIKACREECVEDIVCFEKTDNLGGLWNYSDEVQDGRGSVMQSTIINTSKEFMSFSDFPAPKESHNFMHNSEVIRVLGEYVEKFDLRRYIKFNTTVQKLTQKVDTTSGKELWMLTYTQGSGQARTEVFDAVMLCSGHHAKPHLPKFPGMDSFKGTAIHTHSYRKPSNYEGQRVLVIGVGNSGTDVAVELSKVAKQVYHSTRRGMWVYPRVAFSGMPADANVTRATSFLERVAPSSVLDAILKKELNRRFDHELYGIQPDCGPTATHITVNDEYPNRLASGLVRVRPDVKKFTEDSVEYVDGRVEEIDAVIIGTGYVFGFPYLEDEVIPVENNKVSLYKLVFPTSVPSGTLAVIGCIQPVGAIAPISELQARWAARVFTRRAKLPSVGEMNTEIRARADEMTAKYVESQRHTIQVSYVPYMDQLAIEVGCRPDFFEIGVLKGDIKLAWKCIIGQTLPYQYRLQGPNAWTGARHAIMTADDRIKYPLQEGRAVKIRSSNGNGKVYILVILFFFLFVYIFLC